MLLILTFSLLDTLNTPQSPKGSFEPQKSLNYGWFFGMLREFEVFHFENCPDT